MNEDDFWRWTDSIKNTSEEDENFKTKKVYISDDVEIGPVKTISSNDVDERIWEDDGGYCKKQELDNFGNVIWTDYEQHDIINEQAPAPHIIDEDEFFKTWEEYKKALENIDDHDENIQDDLNWSEQRRIARHFGGEYD